MEKYFFGKVPTPGGEIFRNLVVCFVYCLSNLFILAKLCPKMKLEKSVWLPRIPQGAPRGTEFPTRDDFFPNLPVRPGGGRYGKELNGPLCTFLFSLIIPAARPNGYMNVTTG